MKNTTPKDTRLMMPIFHDGTLFLGFAWEAIICAEVEDCRFSRSLFLELLVGGLKNEIREAMI